MSSPIHMPKLGLTMTEGPLPEWLIASGETVRQGPPVASMPGPSVMLTPVSYTHLTLPTKA